MPGASVGMVVEADDRVVPPGLQPPLGGRLQKTERHAVVRADHASWRASPGKEGAGSCITLLLRILFLYPGLALLRKDRERAYRKSCVLDGRTHTCDPFFDPGGRERGQKHNVA